MRPGIIILNQSGSLPTLYGLLKMPDSQVLPNEYERLKRFVLAHLSRGLKVGYCDRSSSIVCSSVRKL